MGWWERQARWSEDQGLAVAVIMGVFVACFSTALSAFDWIDGLIAGAIWFLGYGLMGWLRFGRSGP